MQAYFEDPRLLIVVAVEGDTPERCGTASARRGRSPRSPRSLARDGWDAEDRYRCRSRCRPEVLWDRLRNGLPPLVPLPRELLERVVSVGPPPREGRRMRNGRAAAPTYGTDAPGGGHGETDMA